MADSSLLQLNRASWTASNQQYEAEKALDLLLFNIDLMEDTIEKYSTDFDKLDRNTLLEMPFEHDAGDPSTCWKPIFSYYSVEKLRQYLGERYMLEEKNFLRKSYSSFLGQIRKIEKSDASEREKIDRFQKLERQIEKASCDVTELHITVNHAIGHDMWENFSLAGV